MLSSAKRWIRVTRCNPCPICKSARWCGISPDGTAAICMRTTSDRPTKNGGYLHMLNGRCAVPMQPSAPPPIVPKHEVIAFARQCRTAVSPARAARFADEMGLSLASLARLWFGWAPAESLRKLGTKCRSEGCWTFPMRDGDGNVLGIRLRTLDGFKYAVTGGHQGLALPDDLPTDGTLLITEGPTDCAALLDLGFAAIGRPSCLGAEEHVLRVLERSGRRDVVIVADSDTPGLEGAKKLAQTILPRTRSTKIIAPPFLKDARAWKQAGATRRTVEAVIAAANYQRRD